MYGPKQLPRALDPLSRKWRTRPTCSDSPAKAGLTGQEPACNLAGSPGNGVCTETRNFVGAFFFLFFLFFFLLFYFFLKQSRIDRMRKVSLSRKKKRKEKIPRNCRNTVVLCSIPVQCGFNYYTVLYKLYLIILFIDRCLNSTLGNKDGNLR